MNEMNDHKICFIIAVTDPKVYASCAQRIDSLKVPSGFTIEKRVLDNPCNHATAYNQAMSVSDAQYKIYLHQETQILNDNILNEIIELFRANAQLGMIGVRGAKTLPVRGLWWDSTRKIGKLYEKVQGKPVLLALGEVSGAFEPVKVLDGVFLATQFDLPWNDQLSGGLGFLESSHSLDFIKQGYEVAVPFQKDAWCMFDGRSVDIDLIKDVGRAGFLAHYAKDFFPLVSLIVLTRDRPDHLVQTLKSVVKQSYKHIEVLVGDYGQDPAVEKALAPYLRSFSQISLIQTEDADIQACMARCLEQASGEFVNVVMEGDVLHVDKISRMMHYATELDSIGLVTSSRQIIDDSGNSLEPDQATKKQFESDVALTGEYIIDSILSARCNVIGELASSLIRTSDLKSGFGRFGGRAYEALLDVATWMQVLAEQKKAIYISDTLCSVRQPAAMALNDRLRQFEIKLDWLTLILSGHESGVYLKDSAVFSQALSASMSDVVNFMTQHHASLRLDDHRLERVQSNLSLACKLLLRDAV